MTRHTFINLLTFNDYKDMPKPLNYLLLTI